MDELWKKSKKHKKLSRKATKLMDILQGPWSKIQTYNGRVYEDDKLHKEDYWKHQTKRWATINLIKTRDFDKNDIFSRLKMLRIHLKTSECYFNEDYKGVTF